MTAPQHTPQHTARRTETGRTQAQRSTATTAQLTEAAQQLFGRHGYAATGVAAVAAAAGVTKGAAYHHFQGKSDLFRAAFVREQEQIAAAVEAAAGQEPDTWSALTTGIRTFLTHCLDQAFRRIVLLDGPAVLGWDTVREIESAHTLRVLSGGMRAAVADGRMADGDDLVLDARVHLLFGAICEAGMLLARAEDPPAALPAVAAEAERLLSALAVTPG